MRKGQDGLHKGACAKNACADNACAKGECTKTTCSKECATACEGCPASCPAKTCPASATLAEACPNASCESKACCETLAVTKCCAKGCDTSACTTGACNSCGCPEKKLGHLLAAAQHLRDAGLTEAANDVFEAARQVRRDLLRVKLDELARLRWEVERLESIADEPPFQPAATANVPSSTPTK